ncbi:MAG: hypothetical protein ACOYM3_24830 [Terrimicrobiaceae bacterium]
MRKKFYPTLVKAAENITESELCHAPELATLIALDATLQATMTLLEFNYPYPGHPESENRDIEDGIEEHMIDSIFNLAKALRSTLTAYYAAVKENCDSCPSHEDISF